MKVSLGWKISLGMILCLCIGGIGYMVFKINTPQEKPETPDIKPKNEAMLYVVRENAWPPTSTKAPIRQPLMALNRVTLSSTRQAQKARIQFSQGQHVAVGDIVVQLDADNEREKLREAEKRFALIQATHDRASALYAVTGSNEETLKALQDRLIEAESMLIQARLALSEREIVAPISGIIDYHIGQEESVLPQQPLATIHSVEKLCVEIGKELFSLEQLHRLKEKTIPVTIIHTDNELYNAPFTLNTNGNLILHIANPNRAYPIGLTVQIDQEALPRTQAITVPLKAIRQLNQKNYVWVKLRTLKTTEAIFIRREVKIAAIANDYAAIASGLESLEEILLNPPEENAEEALQETLSLPIATQGEASLLK